MLKIHGNLAYVDFPEDEEVVTAVGQAARSLYKASLSPKLQNPKPKPFSSCNYLKHVL